MIKKLFELWIKHKTKGYKQIPIFTMTFNLKMYREDKKSKSCTFYAFHPDLRDDEFVKEKLCEVVDYIRENYDMEELVRID